MKISQETYDFALPIINEWLADNPIRKRNGTVIPYKTLKDNDLIDWIHDGITEQECLDVAREYAEAIIEDMNYCNSQEHQDYLVEQDAVNREMWG